MTIGLLVEAVCACVYDVLCHRGVKYTQSIMCKCIVVKVGEAKKNENRVNL